MDYEQTDAMFMDGADQVKLGRRMTIAGALKAGEALVIIQAFLPYGGVTDYLKERGVPRTTAHRWVSHFKTGLTITEIESHGGISATLDMLKWRTRQPMVFHMEQPHTDYMGLVEDAQIGEPLGSIEGHDNPQTAEEAMAEVSSKMAEPVKKPSQLELFQEQVTALRGENTDLQYRLESMERQLKEAQQQAGMPHEKAAVSNQQEAIISALRSELHQERVQHNELKDAHRGAVRRLRQLEEK